MSFPALQSKIEGGQKVPQHQIVTESAMGDRVVPGQSSSQSQTTFLSLMLVERLVGDHEFPRVSVHGS